MDILLPAFQLLYFVLHFLYSLAQSVASTWHLLARVAPWGQCQRGQHTLPHSKQLAKTPRHLGIVVSLPSVSVGVVVALVLEAAVYGVEYLSIYDVLGEFTHHRKAAVLGEVRRKAGGMFCFLERHGDTEGRPGEKNTERNIDLKPNSGEKLEERRENVEERREKVQERREEFGKKEEKSTGNVNELSTEISGKSQKSLEKYPENLEKSPENLGNPESSRGMAEKSPEKNRVKKLENSPENLEKSEKSRGNLENSPGNSEKPPENLEKPEKSRGNLENSPGNSGKTPENLEKTENSPENLDRRPVVTIQFLGVDSGRHKLAAAAEQFASATARTLHSGQQGAGHDAAFPGLRWRGKARHTQGTLLPGIVTAERSFKTLGAENDTVESLKHSLGLDNITLSTLKHSLGLPSAASLGLSTCRGLSSAVSLGLPDPELVITLGLNSTLGYPPWQLRAAEIHFLDLCECPLGLGRVLEAYAGCEQRWGR